MAVFRWSQSSKISIANPPTTMATILRHSIRQGARCVTRLDPKHQPRPSTPPSSPPARPAPAPALPCPPPPLLHQRHEHGPCLCRYSCGYVVSVPAMPPAVDAVDRSNVGRHTLSPSTPVSQITAPTRRKQPELSECPALRSPRRCQRRRRPRSLDCRHREPALARIRRLR